MIDAAEFDAITGQWDYRELPANVQLGQGCWIEREASFESFRSQQPRPRPGPAGWPRQRSLQRHDPGPWAGWRGYSRRLLHYRPRHHRRQHPGGDRRPFTIVAGNPARIVGRVGH